MKPQIVLTIYRKEILEMLRDRRTLISMVLVPVLAIPLLLAAVPAAIATATAAYGLCVEHRAFGRGVRSVRAALEDLHATLVSVPELAPFQNVNTPQDWAGYAPK